MSRKFKDRELALLFQFEKQQEGFRARLEIIGINLYRVIYK